MNVEESVQNKIITHDGNDIRRHDKEKLYLHKPKERIPI